MASSGAVKQTVTLPHHELECLTHAVMQDTCAAVIVTAVSPAVIMLQCGSAVSDECRREARSTLTVCNTLRHNILHGAGSVARIRKYFIPSLIGSQFQTVSCLVSCAVLIENNSWSEKILWFLCLEVGENI